MGRESARRSMVIPRLGASFAKMQGASCALLSAASSHAPLPRPLPRSRQIIDKAKKHDSLPAHSLQERLCDRRARGVRADIAPGAAKQRW